MNKQQLQNIFQEEYNRENWLKLFPAIFPKFEQLAKPTDFDANNNKIESLKQLGTLTLKEDKKIAVFEVKVSDKTNLPRNRVELNNVISGFIDQWQTHAAIGVFYKSNVAQASSLRRTNKQDACSTLENNNRDGCATLDYRFTFAQRQTVWGKKGMKDIKTHSKRYTYVLGPNEFCKTAAERFSNLAERKSIVKMDDIIEAFSVEKLSKQFYNELSHWYFWAIKHVTFPSEPTIENVAKKTGKEDHNKLKELINEHNAKNVIRLLTRFLFVWFIKQKKLIPDELFDLNILQKEILNEFSPYHEDGLFKEANRNSIYYKSILQNLFFASLNCPINTRQTDKRARGFRLNNSYGQHRDANYMMRYEKYFKNPNKFLELMNSIVPFLNGGLFECLDDKLNNIYIDGFSDQMTKGEKLVVPDYLFFGLEEKTDLTAELGIKNKSIREASVKGLINILKSYNFTIVENTPIDEEVALDPELLGKVFENLLASYNPETKTTARKQTGSFYTPREIVDYMVDESLKVSIANSVTEKLKTCSEEDIKVGLDILFAYTDISVNFDADNEHAFTENEVDAIINAVSNLKILDPACGSGAFPMGILHKLVFILEKLDPDNTKWRALQKEKVLQETDEAYNMGKEERNQHLEEIREAFDSNNSNYGRKLFLVENCIYGVDIQPIATQISKLRFFISLIVDQIVDKSKENFSVRPLPNLETKFVTANTLIGIESDEGLLPDPKIKSLEKQLKDVRHRLFSSKSQSHKRKLCEDDKVLRTQIAAKLEDNGLGHESAQLLAKWDPYDQNASSPFFDMDWMFGIKNGFDIVIGNPPYLRIQGLLNSCPFLVEEYKKTYKSATGRFDLYCVFTELGLSILSQKGLLNYIMPLKWTNASFGKGLREIISKGKHLNKILSFGAMQLFSASTYSSLIWLAQKEQADFNYTEKKNISNVNDLRMALSQNTYSVIQSDSIGNKPWILANEESMGILSKIQKQPYKVLDIFEGIYQGIVTGDNDIFWITDCKDLKDTIEGFSKVLNKRVEIEKKILKPLMTGNTIGRYSSNYNNTYILYTYKINDYKTVVYEEDELKNSFPKAYNYLLKQKDRLSSRGSKNMKYPRWYSLWNQRQIQRLTSIKILTPDVCHKGSMWLDETGKMFHTDTSYALLIKQEYSKFIKGYYGILNSNILWFFLNETGAVLRGNYFRFKTSYLIPFHLPIIQNNICAKKINDVIEKISEITTNGKHLRNKQKKIELLQLETEIDARVAHLYNLTEEEYAIILNDTEADFRIKALNFHRNLLKGLFK